MAKTKIEWCDRSLNPVTGCSRISEGCERCFCMTMGNRMKSKWGYGVENEITYHPERLQEIAKWKTPQRVFLGSMTDLFHKDVEEDFLHELMNCVWDNKMHTFMVLTKRPERMYEFMHSWYTEGGVYPDRDKIIPNLWLGVTAENQKRADERIPWLLKTPAAVRFVSHEPALGPIRFVSKDDYSWLSCDGKDKTGTGENECCESYAVNGDHYSGIDWVIVGAETGRGARYMESAIPQYDLKQCKSQGVAFFMKQFSNKAPIPADLMIREFPGEQP